MKKVLLIVAQKGFQPKEYKRPKQILEDGGIEVITASEKVGIAISSYSNEKILVDIPVDQVKVGEYDGIFLIGGPQALQYLDNDNMYNIMKEANEVCAVLGAICISPRILAKAGVLKNKKATGWDDDGKLKSIFEDVGAKYIKEPVVQDGKVITAWGPDAAEAFGRLILANL